jgi:hypothetical protein
MFLESHNWQPFGPHRFVAAKPHWGSAICSAMPGGTGCWPFSQKTARLASLPDIVSKAAIANNLYLMFSLHRRRR